ncbi:MAG: hypothetical protein HRU29_06185 [Rhizobiales bacterium]|nr:hypothetical protein [Hyphomicrobiales bacterium]NRB13974.1 hypothetical protein [Hyphomicrobiales bacterium]
MGLLLAGLMLLMTYIHGVIGGKKIWRPMLKHWQSHPQNKLIKGSLGFIWHAITLWFIAASGLAIYAYFSPDMAEGIYFTLMVLFFSFGVVATLYGKLIYGLFGASPQWMFFWPITITAFLAFISA